MSRNKIKGKLIAFEGVDGCGKTTQVSLLKEKLERYGKKVLKVEEPGGTALGRKIRDILLTEKNLKIEPLTELFLYQTSRCQLIRRKVKPALEEGTHVLMDRFYLSSLAYQGYGRGVDLSTVKCLNKISTNGLIPDLTILIRLPLEEIVKRKENEKPDRIEKENLEFYRHVIKGFEESIAEEKNRLILNGVEPRKKLSEKIYRRVENLIG